MELKPRSTSNGKSGVWALHEGGIVCLEPAAAGHAVVLVPSERVLLLTADLPLPTRRQRAAALPFAVEERLADPLGSVHIALGAEIGERRYVAGAVRHEVMRGWLEMLESEGLGRAAVVPDCLALPVAGDGAWSVDLRGGRALVRAADGTGFAIAATLLPPAWSAAGRPMVTTYGEAMPAAMGALQTSGSILSLTSALSAPALDLRQGPYASRSQPAIAALKQLAVVLAAGAVAHAGIAAADTLALNHIADQRRAETLALVRTVAPATPEDADLIAEFDRLVPTTGAGRSAFLPLLARTSRALQPLASTLAVRNLSYAGADGAMTLQVEASDMAGLQQVQAALGAAGLNPASGAATARAGGADGQFIVREAPR